MQGLMIKGRYAPVEYNGHVDYDRKSLVAEIQYDMQRLGMVKKAAVIAIQLPTTKMDFMLYIEMNDNVAKNDKNFALLTKLAKNKLPQRIGLKG